MEPAVTRRQLRNTLDSVEKERQMLDALCVNYSAAYCCDLKTDRMTPVKQRSFSHCARERGKLQDQFCYSEWIRHAYDSFVIHESAPDYMEVFDAKNIMKRLETEKSFVYRHRTKPNGAGMEYFETTVVRLYTDEHTFQIIMGYRPIDDIIAEEQKHQQLEQERLRLAYELAESANAAKTTFLLNMSHDIRTPMNAILGYAQLMKGKLTDPELLHYQEMIEQSGNLLLSVINNVLDMARIESGKMELDKDYHVVGDVGASVCGVFQMEAQKKNLTLTHTVDITHRHVICDKTKMQEVMTNIVSNAVKYTPPGGHIRVDTRELPCEKPGYINIQTSVTDTGIGMSKEFLPHLFDSFSRERNTTAARVAGSGLGMSIVKSLVDLMGGTIEVESELGKGSKFTFTVPHRIADVAEGGEDPAQKETPDFTGRHVLLAEDNDLNAEIATAILKEMGLTVDRAEDGIICVAKLEQSAPGTYDLIFMDVQMPNMDGYKATQVIRRLPDKEKANIPIIAMTANAFAEDRKKALDMGMNGHIAKPIAVPKIAEVLRDVLK